MTAAVLLPGLVPPRLGRLRAISFALLFLGLGFAALWAASLATFAITLVVAILALAVATRLPQSRRVERVVRRLAHPSGPMRRLTAATIGIASTIYLMATAMLQGRSFAPVWHDEYSYLLQARMLVSGHLAMPMHPLHEFFDTFHVLTEPVYASMYPAGTSLMLVPALWLGAPPWLMPLLACSFSAALLYLVVADLIDGVAGLAAVLVLTASTEWRHLSLSVLSQPFVVLMILLALWALVHWRRTGYRGWAALAGAATGWAMITRPIDSLALIAGLAIGVALVARRQSARSVVAAVAIAMIAAAPFVAWQAWNNAAVTGSWRLTAYGIYHQQHYPEVGFGFRAVDADAPILGGTRQKRRFAELRVRKVVLNHRPGRLLQAAMTERLPLTARVLFGLDPLLAALIPVGVLAVGCRRRLPVAVIGPIALALYLFYPFYAEHYTVVALPSLILLVVGGLRVCGVAWRRWIPAPRMAGLVLVGVTALIQLPEIDRRVRDARYDPPEARRIGQVLAELPHRPAIVLFRYSDTIWWRFEPVYNVDVAWPDDADVVRAHDLGERNEVLIKYYAARQPDRHVYVYDRGSTTLTHLGIVGDLWESVRGRSRVGGEIKREPPLAPPST